MSDVKVTMVPVKTQEQVEQLAEMASEIWHEYWPSLIGEAQTDYMVEMFHSVPAMLNDMQNNNYRFWFVQADDGRIVGYTGAATEALTGNPEHDAHISHSKAVDEKWQQRFFISKIYIYSCERGKHFCSAILKFYEQLAREEGYDMIYLTVNRDNEMAIRAYAGNGFYCIEDVDNPIGEGFVMFDHIMVKELS